MKHSASGPCQKPSNSTSARRAPLMPTFEAEDRFRQEYLRLSIQKKAVFLKARNDFFAWLVAKKHQPDLAPPAHLRLHFIESKDAWSITFGATCGHCGAMAKKSAPVKPISSG